ncbi:alpha/beta hydrolase [Achromobacter xylosoxidans]|nr:alpha/beta hydrolase [Achromobacter xylosoxidans]
MFRSLLPSLCALLAWLPAQAQPTWQYLLPRPDGSAIAYYLQRHDPTRAADSLLVVAQGSDCNSVAHNRAIHRYLRHALPGADLLTVDKYGIEVSLPYRDDDGSERADCPPAYLRHDNLDQRVRDYAAVIGLLRRQEGYRRVVAVGGSEGAVVANLLAARGGLVDASIAFNGGGRWFLEDVLHGIATGDAPASEKAQSIEGLRGFARYVSETPSSDLVASNHGHEWWRQALALDQRTLLEQVRTPLLVIQAGADTSVSPDSVARMVDALRRAGRGNIEYRAYPGLDHGLREPDGTPRMGEVAADMAAWIGALPPPAP